MRSTKRWSISKFLIQPTKSMDLDWNSRLSLGKPPTSIGPDKSRDLRAICQSQIKTNKNRKILTFKKILRISSKLTTFSGSGSAYEHGVCRLMSYFCAYQRKRNVPPSDLLMQDLFIISKRFFLPHRRVNLQWCTAMFFVPTWIQHRSSSYITILSNCNVNLLKDESMMKLLLSYSVTLGEWTTKYECFNFSVSWQ